MIEFPRQFGEIILVAVKIPTMQQNDHRLFLPVLTATVEPAMNDIVLREVARSRCGKAEMQSRFVGIELNPRWLAFGGNEVRAFQELKRFLQPQIRSIRLRLRHEQGFNAKQDLNGRPVNTFGQRPDHTNYAVSEDSWHPLPEGITHENGHGDVAIAPRPAVGSDPTEGHSGEQNQREERHEKRD